MGNGIIKNENDLDWRKEECAKKKRNKKKMEKKIRERKKGEFELEANRREDRNDIS